MVTMFVFTETSKLLVCYWRSRVLCESGSGLEDEPVGQVSPPPTPVSFLKIKMALSLRIHSDPLCPLIVPAVVTS